MIPISILDLSPITQGSLPADSFRRTVDLARHAEGWGYRRYWLAEHHGMPGIASAATAVLIGHVADATKTLVVGAGGIMLPNHAPLVIAEQFGTLAALHPGRIELGLGRAPGSDPVTSRALRRNLTSDPEAFPDDVVELMDYFAGDPRRPVRAVPGAGAEVPIWILGSSTFGAQLAAALGLPYAFASHFAPAMLMRAIEVYRSQFRPSKRLAQPYVMAGFNVFAADTDAEGEFIASSAQQSFIAIRTGHPVALPPPRKNFLAGLEPFERGILDQTLSAAAIGNPETVREQIETFVAATGVDELMVTSNIYDHQARLHSYELLAQLRGEPSSAPTWR